MSVMSTPRSARSFTHKVTEYGDTYVNKFASPDHDLEKPGIYVEGDVKILKTIELNNEGMCCKFNANADKLAVGLVNGDIKIFQAFGGECIYHLSDEHTKKNRLPVTSMNFLSPPDSNRGELLAATYAGGMIKIWHISTSTALQTISESCQLLTSSISPSASNMVVGGSSAELYVYDVERGEKINTCSASPSRLIMDGHRSRILAVKYHLNDANMFLSGGWDDTVQIWDQREKRSIRSLFGPHICGEGLDIDEENNHILTASWRKHEVLQVWDYKMGTKIKTIPSDFSYDSLLYCGQWLGKNKVLCGGSDNNMIRIVDRTSLVTSGMICNLPSGVYSVDHDKQRLALKQQNNDVTMIIGVAGKHLYFISNAVNPSKKEDASS